MKKKVLSALLALVMCVGLCFAFSGCNNTQYLTTYSDNCFTINVTNIKYYKSEKFEAEQNRQIYNIKYTIIGNLTSEYLYNVKVTFDIYIDDKYEDEVCTLGNNSTVLMLGNETKDCNTYFCIQCLPMGDGTFVFAKGVDLKIKKITVKHEKFIL